MSAALKFHWRSRAAAALGLIAVAAGAVGAHAFKATLALSPEGPERWKTAVLYQLVHAVMLFLSTRPELKLAWWCWFFGAVIFPGSLYALALTQNKTFAHIAPVGGVLLILGWLFCIIFPHGRTLKS